MALKPSYANANTLKKLTVGGSTYFLKDEDLRKLVESFGDSVYKNVVTTFNPDGVDIATEKATADFIKTQLGGIGKAMRFMGIVERAQTREIPQSDLEAITAHYEAKGMVPVAGDVVIMKDNAKEYIYSGSEWEEIGDQSIYLTIAAAASTYTPMTRTVAGLALTTDLTKDALSAPEALDLKALSHKDQAQGTVEVTVGAEDLTVAKAGAYTVTGSEVAVPSTFNAMDVTPEGTIDVAAGTAAAAKYQKATSAVISAAAAGPEEEGNYVPEGEVALPSITAGVTLQPEAVDTVTNKGTAYQLTDGAVEKAEDIKAKFVKKGMSFTMDEGEECLTLAYVDNSDGEFYTDAVTAAGAVSYTKPELTGALPTFGTKNVAKATGATSEVNVAGTATFTGKATKLTTAIGYTQDDATVTQPTFTATFNGSSKSVTPEAATTVQAQAPKATVTVATETQAITLKKETKTVTVK